MRAPSAASGYYFPLFGFFTFIVGIAPATLLAVFSALLLIAAIGATLFEPERANWLIVLLSLPAAVMGLVGYAALWLAALRPVMSAAIAIGLVVGILGAASGVGILATEGHEYLSPGVVPIFGGPVLMAIAHLLRYWFQQRRESGAERV